MTQSSRRWIGCAFLAIATSGCARPRWQYPEQQALAFLQPYISRQAQAYRDGNLEIDALGTPYHDPDVTTWKLRWGDRELKFTLTCIGGCSAYEWPRPEWVATGPDQDRSVDAMVVASSSPLDCGPGHYVCCRPSTFQLRRLKSGDGDTYRYEVTRCGGTHVVAVHCNQQPPYQCKKTEEPAAAVE